MYIEVHIISSTFTKSDSMRNWMLTFNPHCKTEHELREKITTGYYDVAIRENIYLHLRDDVMEDYK